MRMNGIKKVLVGFVGGVAAAASLILGGQAVKDNGQNVQADHTTVEHIKLGSTYKRGYLSFKVSEYKVNGRKNYVITTNLKKKQFYQVGSNDDKQGRTKGITVAFGNDQR